MFGYSTISKKMDIGQLVNQETARYQRAVFIRIALQIFLGAVVAILLGWRLSLLTIAR